MISFGVCVDGANPCATGFVNGSSEETNRQAGGPTPPARRRWGSSLLRRPPSLAQHVSCGGAEAAAGRDAGRR